MGLRFLFALHRGPATGSTKHHLGVALLVCACETVDNESNWDSRGCALCNTCFTFIISGQNIYKINDLGPTEMVSIIML